MFALFVSSLHRVACDSVSVITCYSFYFMEKIDKNYHQYVMNVAPVHLVGIYDLYAEVFNMMGLSATQK
jgi:hypothetical protein